MRFTLSAITAVGLVLAAPLPALAQQGAQPPQSAAAGAVASVESPQGVVSHFQDVLRQAMQTADFQARYGTLRSPVEQSFHLDVMLRTIAGGAWREATDAQREALRQAFADLTAANYAARFHNYSGQSFEVTEVGEGPRGAKIVRTRIVRPGKEPVGINYVVAEQDGHWGIVDIVVGGGVSELATKKSEYGAILKRQGIDGLIETLRIKSRELTSGA